MLIFSQHLDQVHCGWCVLIFAMILCLLIMSISDSRGVCVHYGLPPPLCGCCARAALFARVRGYSVQTVDKLDFLPHDASHPCCLLVTRLRVEVVRCSNVCFRVCAHANALFLATQERIHPSRITLRRSCKSTTSQTTDRVKSSQFFPRYLV
jgi:hypothetical protein